MMLNGALPYHIAKRNKSAIEQLKSKVIVFVIPEGPLEGPQKNDVRFPFDGKIVEVFASCHTAGTSDTRIRVETISLEAFESDAWTGAVDGIVLAAQKRIHDSNLVNIHTPSLKANDYVRVVVDSAGGAKDLHIEVVVELDI